MRRTLGRRSFLAASLAAGVGVALPASLVRGAVRSEGRRAPIRPRSDWGAGHPPVGALATEPDVRFLLVHHTATANAYDPREVPGILRAIYRFHTGEKGWPDVAYNFFVDRFGAVWEGRAGSLHTPVQGSATGGSQGFALLCSFLGDHTSEPPSQPALDAMTALLAGLASRYGIDTRPEARTSFVSRGSNRWPAGTEVTTATIAGHRDMSLTACPGDAGYRVVRDVLPVAVAALTAPASPTLRTAPGTATPSSSAEPAPAEPAASASRSPAAADRPQTNGRDNEEGALPLIGVGAAGAAVAGALYRRRRRQEA